MFFKLKQYDKGAKRIGFAAKTEICSDGLEFGGFIRSTLGKLRGEGESCLKISFTKGFPKRVKEKIKIFSDSDEAYAIEIDKNTKIFAKSEKGFLYAVMTLKALAESHGLFSGFIFDAPICDVRGYRVFLPKRSGFDDFKKTVDFLAEYKYNAIMLEIGGAMEYKRHPEINERWAEFCVETHAYSGRTLEIQRKLYPWKKNSIHTDNAEGDILTQDECRELAEYCRSRGLEVIPECPTFSHCDYIVMAHPEIREREGDEYPDTYCPNHPDTYPLVFDLLDEVIEVFKPKKMNIGHDEAYSVGVCPRCKKTSAPIIYANDVKRIHSFLGERGIETMMWGEKLLNAYAGREAIGGAGHGKGLAKVNALYPCRDLLPRDITILHWYYVFNPEYDKVYHERGMKTVFGNLSVLSLAKWDERIKWGTRGGFVSNWGSFGEEYMQRNCQYFDLVSAAYAFWCEDFGKMSREEQLDLTAKELYRLKCEKIKNPIKITHKTDFKMKYKVFYDGVFIVDDEYMLGNYKITYSDGECATIPVKFGTNIGTHIYDDYKKESAFREVCYSTLPIRYKHGFAYESVFEDPRPEGEIVGISYEPLEKRRDVKVELISFARDASTAVLRESGIAHRDGEDFAWDGDTVNMNNNKG